MLPICFSSGESSGPSTEEVTRSHTHCRRVVDTQLFFFVPNHLCVSALPVSGQVFYEPPKAEEAGHSPSSPFQEKSFFLGKSLLELSSAGLADGMMQAELSYPSFFVSRVVF